MPAILPPGRTRFVDANGNPLANGNVYFYSPGTLIAKATWTTEERTVQNPNPIPLDAGGYLQNTAWGIGEYRQQVFDQNAVLIWDTETGQWPDPQSVPVICTIAGTGNALTAAPVAALQNTGVDAYVQGLTVLGILPAGNTGAATLNFNGLGVKPVYKDAGAGPVALVSGDQISGNLYAWTYDTALNAGGGGWHRGGPGGPAADIASLLASIATINGQITTINGQITTINNTLTSLQSQITGLLAVASNPGGGQVGTWAWITFAIGGGHYALLWGSIINLTAPQDLSVTMPFSYGTASYAIVDSAQGTNAATHQSRYWNKTVNSFTASNDGANTISTNIMIIGGL